MSLRKEVIRRLTQIRKETVESCEECDDGYILTEEGDLITCQCMQVFVYLMELVKSKIPQEYWCLSLSDLVSVDETYIKLVKHYTNRMSTAIKKSMGVIFYGANGIGKTSLMCHIGKLAVASGYKVQYFTVQQYIDAVKGDSPIVKEYTDCEIILLDEMDKVYAKKGSDYVTKTLEDFIRRSLSSGKVIIACTNNSDMDEFSQMFGDSTVSMLKRHSKFLEIAGEDYSDQLHDSWWEDLDEDYDYFCPEIVEKAEFMHTSVEAQEDEEWA